MKNHYILYVEAELSPSQLQEDIYYPDIYYIIKSDTYNPKNRLLLEYKNVDEIDNLMHLYIAHTNKISNEDHFFFTEEEINDEEFHMALYESLQELNERENLFTENKSLVLRFIPISNLKTLYMNLDEHEDDKNKFEKEIDKIKNDFSQMSEDLKSIKDLLNKVLNMNNGGNKR